MKRMKASIILLIMGVLIVGCSSPNEDSVNSKGSNTNLEIYTTVYPLQYIVEEIGGDTVTAHSVYPPGADGHIYEPTSKEMTKFANGDAFIYIGAGMEGFAESVSNALEPENVRLIEIAEHEELFQKGGHSNVEHDDVEHIIGIEGLAAHYHSNDTITLTATFADGSELEHLHWSTLNPDSEEWEIAEEQHGETYEGEATISGQQIKAAVYDDNHDIVSESLPVTIKIDDHEGHDNEGEEHNHDHEGEEHAHEDEAVIIEGLAGHYHTGDVITLTSEHSEGSSDEHWHWFTMEPGSAEWDMVKEQYSNTYEGEATTNGLQIKAVLYDHNHEIVSESEPKRIMIDDHTDHDPHIWVDPQRMIKIAEVIKAELIALNPNETELYNENFTTLKDKLTVLDESFLELLDKKESKYIIVPHSAFGYWEERYGIKQITISGLSSGEEPSQKDLVKVMKAAEVYDLEYILYEQNSDNRLSKVVQEEIGAEDLTIHNLEVRTDEDIKNGEDYISLMEYNLQILDKITK